MIIFVFGSNLAGIHGAGSALHAKLNYGAEQGVGEGRTGNAYAIPTKNTSIKTIPLRHIQKYVDKFKEYAWSIKGQNGPELQFLVTQVGCGLAGYLPRQIAPMFKGAPDNCFFASAWGPYLTDHRERATAALEGLLTEPNSIARKDYARGVLDYLKNR